MKNLIAFIGLSLASVGYADVVFLNAAADNTLYQVNDGTVSNGNGETFFAGTTLNGVTLRRGLIRFDLSGISLDAEITAVRLTLHMSRSISLSQPVSLHKALGSWGEGTSNAPGEEGAGDVASDGDATWLHRFHTTTFWQNPGGDFEEVASSSKSVNGNGFYTWSGPGMVTDAQGWLGNGESNFGWAVLGEEGLSGTAKRFDSRENADISVRPVLRIDYVVIPAPGVLALGGAFIVGTCGHGRRRR